MFKVEELVDDIFSKIVYLFEKNKDIVKQPKMEAYMKNQFKFYGIPQPARRIIEKELKNYYQLEWDDLSKRLILKLWEADQREFQYLAMEIMKTFSQKMTLEDLDWIEKLIISKSWWDTVDFLATRIIGPIMNKNKNNTAYALSRIQHDNMWLNRTALLFQLKYKTKTDWDLLQQLILMTEHSKEFFIRKAQGWALREYSKTNPKDVRIFIENNSQLSGLTKREGLKYCQYL